VIAQAIVTAIGLESGLSFAWSIALLLGLPLSWRYIRERGPVREQSAPVAHSGFTWQQGMRSYAFWIIVAVLFVGSISMNGAITHLAALLTDGNYAGEAALCASILAAQRAGPIVVGSLLRPVFRRAVAFVVSLITGGGNILLGARILL